MSQIKLLHSGGNGVILAAPTSNPSSDVTFKLPQADGTSGQALTTNASGQLAFASVGGGKILQEVSTSSTTTVSGIQNTTALLNVSITPSATSSKILLLTSVGVYIYGSGNCFAELKMYRGDISGTEIFNQRGGQNEGTNTNATFGFTLVDSPNTTSATTYTISVARGSSNTTSVSTDAKNYSLIALEIGA